MPRIRIKPKGGGAKALDDFRKKLETSPKLLETISKNVGEEIVGLVKDEFRAEKNPYGSRWAPKKRPDGRKVLSGKTSRLKDEWHVAKVSKRGFTVAPGVNYATFHQSGTRFIPQRMMVPDGGLPSKWARAIKETVSEILERHFKR